MNRKFINFTNHPSSSWSTEQLDAALPYGEIIDIPFPNVPPAMTSQENSTLGAEYTSLIMKHVPTVILCQGEFSLAYNVIKHLRGQTVTVLAACSERNTITISNERRSIFCFVHFREYL